MSRQQISIRTPFNRRDLKGRPDRRVLRHGHWVRTDPMADNVYAWLKAGYETAVKAASIR